MTQKKALQLVEYQAQLEQIADFMKTKGAELVGLQFPKSCCDHTSRLVREVVGLDVALGRIKYGGRYLGEMHTRNFDPQTKLYIDLTMNQFGDYPQILIEKNPQDWIQYDKLESNRIVTRVDQLVAKELEQLVDAFSSSHPTINIKNKEYKPDEKKKKYFWNQYFS